MKKYRKISPRRVRKQLQSASKTISRLHGSIKWHEDHEEQLYNDLHDMNTKCNNQCKWILVLSTINIVMGICLIMQMIYSL